MKKLILSSVLSSMCVIARAADSDSLMRSSLVTDDEWAYRQTSETMQVGSDIGQRFVIGSPTKDDHFILGASPLRLAGAQRVWSLRGVIGKRVCLIDLDRGDTLGLTDSCTISLTPGVSWTADHADTAVHIKKTFKIMASEMVEVPAGKFFATRIDSEELRSEVINPLSVPMGLGDQTRLVTKYWYAPEAKGMVKVERERYNVTGKRTDHSQEVLVQFTHK